MAADFAAFAETLRRACRRRPVYYMPNLGNWGDALIRYGTTKFLRDIGLECREVSRHKRDWVIPCLTGGTVLVGGGGAWCRLWNRSAQYVRRLSRRFRVIVLPSTYESHYDVPNTTFFCRDRFESMANMPGAAFCHDLAFYIGREFASDSGGEGTGWFLREDAESAGRVSVPPENDDISAEGTHKSPVAPFFRRVGRFATIHTDRLHVAIAGCLLGREVHLYPSSYFKIRAVYRSSIAPFFPNAHLHV